MKDNASRTCGLQTSLESPSVVEHTRYRINSAYETIQPYIVRTPLLSSRRLNDQLRCSLFVKAECLQHTGSFKFRGALNKILSVTRRAFSPHLLTWSSGNHGAAVAEVARLLGIPATIVAPPWIPEAKKNNIRCRGAKLHVAGSVIDIASFGTEMAADLGATVIPAYDDPFVIEGQASVTLEVLKQFEAQCGRAVPDVIVLPCGGGSLAAGAALAVEDEPNIRLIAAEPSSAADTKISLAAGRPCKDPNAGPTICDALRNPLPGAETFEIMKRSVRDVHVLDDKAVLDSMRVLFEHFRLVSEPAGAIALAAVLSNFESLEGQNVVVVVSGGNVSRTTFYDAIRGCPFDAALMI
ncbi:serine dehydratase [Pandoraea pneumonica]|uniref:Serine dehydratase n=1 Tax=Pandoraea pneumonica TaxID=2508299 RepID=A0A5E4Z349_9BURK|nr:pyridoxal-phosphate dependent enzyme [Pandoraea pneumonica]VVE54563.1 serine dehydratase [Pandoraea pneumonica]